ncbi:MAG: hypothetical protein HY726_00605 [Candidatus Rokubacteria bacterium]|nr:hypothetical protein [Candidatus Rokubacteria bacterium]
MSLFISLVMLPVAAVAQDASEPQKGEIRLEIKQSDIPVRKGTRPIVRPLPSPEVAAEDAEQVMADLEAARAQKDIGRDVTGGRSRRSHLDYDVTNGIQQQNLLRALPR